MSDIIEAVPHPGEIARKEKPFPALLPSIGWIALYFALQVIVTVVIISTSLVAQKIADPATALNSATAADNPMLIIWGLVGSAIVQLGLMWLYLRKGDRAEALGLTHLGRISVGNTVLIAIGALLVATAFNYVYATYVIPGMPMQDEMAKLLASIPRTPINIATGLFAIAIVAPLIEELLFRGLLQRSLMHYVPAWAAIILSAFTFALVHMQPLAMPALMALGAAFGFIYHKTGSLRMTIILHMINNALALALTQAV